MIGKIVQRGISSFTYSVAINVVLFTILIVMFDRPEFVPMLSGYMEHFQSVPEALLVQIILIGLTSAVFGAGSFLLELERLSMLAQSIIYFLVTALVWVPISCFCWEIHKYPQSFITVTISYTVSYIVSWIVQYRLCKSTVKEINQKLVELKQET